MLCLLIFYLLLHATTINSSELSNRESVYSLSKSELFYDKRSTLEVSNCPACMADHPVEREIFLSGSSVMEDFSNVIPYLQFPHFENATDDEIQTAILCKLDSNLITAKLRTDILQVSEIEYIFENDLLKNFKRCITSYNKVTSYAWQKLDALNVKNELMKVSSKIEKEATSFTFHLIETWRQLTLIEEILQMEINKWNNVANSSERYVIKFKKEIASLTKKIESSKNKAANIRKDIWSKIDAVKKAREQVDEAGNFHFKAPWYCKFLTALQAARSACNAKSKNKSDMQNDQKWQKAVNAQKASENALRSLAVMLHLEQNVIRELEYSLCESIVFKTYEEKQQSWFRKKAMQVSQIRPIIFHSLSYTGLLKSKANEFKNTEEVGQATNLNETRNLLKKISKQLIELTGDSTLDLSFKISEDQINKITKEVLKSISNETKKIEMN